MATSFSALSTRLQTRLRDTTGITFSSAEITEVMTQAVNDPFVSKTVRDTSLTTIASTYSYTCPTGIDEIYELGVNIDSDGIFHAIPRDHWDLIDGTIYLLDKNLPSSVAIQIIGKSKFDTTTADFPVKQHEYILELAMAAAFEMLKTSLTTRFIKNDMTMSDLINSINTHKQRAEEIRRNLINQRLVTL